MRLFDIKSGMVWAGSSAGNSQSLGSWELRCAVCAVICRAVIAIAFELKVWWFYCDMKDSEDVKYNEISRVIPR